MRSVADPTRHGQGKDADGAVLDFCLNPPQAAPGVWVRQRLVIFDIGGEAISGQAEPEVDAKGNVIPGSVHYVFQRARLHEHVRQVFLGTFPMKRFQNVFALTPAPPNFPTTSVDNATMIGAAGNDTFAAYSIACADWVAMPRVTRREVKWKQVTKQRKDAKGNRVDYWAWDPQLGIDLALDVFKHEGDVWTRIATTDGSNGGLFGVAASLAAGAMAGSDTGDVSTHLSARPQPSCKIPVISEARDVIDGFKNCWTAGEGAVGVITHVDLEKVLPDPEDVAKDVQARISGAGEVLVEHANQLTPEEQVKYAMLAARGNIDVKALADLAELELPGAPAQLTAAFAAAKSAVNTCKDSVSTIGKAEKALRSLASLPSLDTVAGFASCLGIPLKIDLGAAVPIGSGQARNQACAEGADAVANGLGGMVAAAICQARIGTDRATLDLQKDTKKIAGWTLHDLLAKRGNTPDSDCIHLGGAEGVARGDRYVAVIAGPRGESDTSSFATVKHVGAGGEAGLSDVSYLAWRAGQAPQNTLMVEYPQVGVVLGARPQMSLLTASGNLKSGAVYGAGIEGGYNATRFVDIADEVWSRIYVSYQVGSERESFVTIDLIPEATWYVASRVAVFTGLGASYVIARKDITEGGATASGASVGAILAFGADFSFNADWNARATLAYRQGLTDADLTSDSGALVATGGSLSSLQLALSAGYIF